MKQEIKSRERSEGKRWWHNGDKGTKEEKMCTCYVPEAMLGALLMYIDLIFPKNWSRKM